MIFIPIWKSNYHLNTGQVTSSLYFFNKHIKTDKMKIGTNIRFKTLLCGYVFFFFFGSKVIFSVMVCIYSVLWIRSTGLAKSFGLSLRSVDLAENLNAEYQGWANPGNNSQPTYNYGYLQVVSIRCFPFLFVHFCFVCTFARK